jgi:hypothetical protein
MQTIIAQENGYTLTREVKGELVDLVLTDATGKEIDRNGFYPADAEDMIPMYVRDLQKGREAVEERIKECDGQYFG